MKDKTRLEMIIIASNNSLRVLQAFPGSKIKEIYQETKLG